MKPRLLHMTETFGAGVYSFLRALSRDLEPEFDITILHGLRDTPQNYREEFSVRLLHWQNAGRSIHPWQDSLALQQAVRVIREVRPDIIHCHSAKAGVLGRLAAALTGQRSRTLYTPHGLSFLQLSEAPWKRSLYKFIEKTLSTIGTVVACSPSEARALSELGIKSVLINNGVEVPPYPHKTFSPPWRIINVGRIGDQKNPKLFNEIAQTFSSRNDVIFIWVGDGPLRHQLSSPNIRVTGWLDTEGVGRELEQAHLYLSTSLWEGLSLSILEGMARGLPLLLHDCPGNGDLVKDNGYLFRSQLEACGYLEELLTPDRLSVLSHRSYEVVQKHFSLTTMTEAYRELYLSLPRS